MNKVFFGDCRETTAAFFTSFAIGGANLAPDASGMQIAAYLSGGPIGIVCAMKFHGWFRGRKKNQ